MKKKEIMSRLFKGAKTEDNSDLLAQIEELWAGKSHILHVGFRNNPDGHGQKLTFGFTSDTEGELEVGDSLNFPLEDTLQVRFTRSENIVKAPNNRVVIAKYKGMQRDELKEVLAMLTQVLSNTPEDFGDIMKLNDPIERLAQLQELLQNQKPM